MALEQRKSSWAITCDCPHCHMELIRHSKEMVLAEAKEENWKVDGSRYECRDCVDGSCPGEAIAMMKYGKTSQFVTVSHDVKAGEEIYDDEGQFAGTAIYNAKAGEQVQTTLVTRPDKDKIYSTEDENGEPKVGSFDQAHGDTLPGITSTADRGDISEKAKDAPAPKRKGVDTNGISNRIDGLFEDIDGLLGGSYGDPDKLN